MESRLQTKIVQFLKEHGAYVIKNHAAPGVPVGCPDILALYETRWLVIEVKASVSAGFRVGQRATLEHLKKWSTFVYVACPENWVIIRDEILAKFFMKKG